MPTNTRTQRNRKKSFARTSPLDSQLAPSSSNSNSNSKATALAPSIAPAQATGAAMGSLSAGVKIDLDIHALATDGRGIGRTTDGRVVFVERALPGDRICAEIVRVRANYCEATLLVVLQPSEQRTLAPCRWYEACGGCQLQHIQPQHHGPIKTRWLMETLARVGRWPEEVRNHVSALLKSVPQPSPFAYRQRVRLHFDGNHVGFKQRGSHLIADLQQCMIAGPILQKHWGALVEVLKEWGMAHSEDLLGARLQCEIEVTETRLQKLCLDVKSFNCSTKVASLRRASLERSLCQSLRTLAFAHVEAYVPISHPHHPNFTVHRESFLQPHRGAIGVYCAEIEAIISRFLQANRGFFESQTFESQTQPTVRAWDLYAGSGVFSGLAIRAAQSLRLDAHCWAVEGVEQAISSCRANHAGQPVTALAADVQHFVTEVLNRTATIGAQELPHIVILDPPRAGAGLETMGTLLQVLAAQKAPMLIIYVACDAASFARDGALMLNQGFEVTALAVCDMFPQTIHFECIGAFEHKGH